MKAPISWLKNLVEINTDIYEIAESLSIAGFEVENIDDLSKSINGVVVGFIKEIKPHPNADKLNLCKVDIGEATLKQIVCGASNVKVDSHVLVATVGTFLPSMGIKIKETKLRGELSSGMICSLNELGIKDQSKGIAILEEFDNEIPKVGSSASKFLKLDDIILDIAITANRPDGMSIFGIAREISTLNRSKLKDNPIVKPLDNYNYFSPLDERQNSIVDDCIYTLHKIEDVNGQLESPNWIKDRIEKTGINSINAVVDITNYVMLETGQPLHSFDADKLSSLIGREATEKDFSVRLAKQDEKFIALDNKEYFLNPNCHVIACNDIPIALAGVMGSNNSCVDSSTNNIWLEAAIFSQKSIRISSRNVGIRTESSSRYEKGISPHITLGSAKRAIDLYNQVFNCKLISYWKSNDIDHKKKIIFLRRDRIHLLLGGIYNDVNDNNKSDIRYIMDNEIVEILTLLGCNLLEKEEGWDVNVPYFRSLDLTREVDLIEEIARLIGYDKFSANLPDPIKPGILTSEQKTERLLRQNLVSSGMQEVCTYSLVPKNNNSVQQIAISNPLLKETSHLRTNLWEEHLNICKRNIDSGKTSCWLFEIGKIYTKDHQEFSEDSILGGALTGANCLEMWTKYSRNNSLDYFSARGLLEKALLALRISTEDKAQNHNDCLHPGKSSEIYVEGKVVGFFGQVHPSIITKMGLPDDTYIFEIKFRNLLVAATRPSKWLPTYKPFPTVPAMERDISIWVNDSISSNDLIKSIKKLGNEVLEKVDLIDRYKSNNAQDERKSLTFRIRYRKRDMTLTDNEINPVHEKIISSLVQKHSAEIRK